MIIRKDSDGSREKTSRVMHAFNGKERFTLHAFIWGGSLLLFVIYAWALPDFRFFWDPSVKWFQILDLLRHNYQDISCAYPARKLDPEFRHMPMAYVSVVGGECRYWFPYALAYVFAPAHQVLGVWSVPLLQHGFSIFILYAMAIVCARLGLSFRATLAALLLFRLGTANLNSVANLEDHVVSAAIFMGAVLICLRVPASAVGNGPGETSRTRPVLCWWAGLLVGCSFAVRPEMAAVGPFLGLALFMTASERRIGFARAIALGAGFALSLGVFLALNQALVDHPLGLRALDPVNRIAYTDIGARLGRAAAHLFLAPEWWLNGLLLQMPLLLAVAFNLRGDLRRASGGDTATFLLVTCAVLLPLLYVSPFGGPHIGFRFGTFLYPLLIPLALRAFRGARKPARVLAAVLICYSIVLTVPLAGYGVVVYRGYLKTHRELKALPADAVILRDDIMWHALSDHYYERPILRVLKDDDVALILERMRSRGMGRVLFARSAARPPRGPLVPAALRAKVNRRGKSAVLDWAILEIAPTKPPR